MTLSAISDVSLEKNGLHLFSEHLRGIRARRKGLELHWDSRSEAVDRRDGVTCSQIIIINSIMSIHKENASLD